MIPPPTDPLKANHQRILLVDDDQNILEVVGRRLESWGYEVLTAEGGEEGLKLVAEQPPDLILLDIMMPKLKGRDVCAMLKANPKTRDIPVIFLTALGMADHVKAGMDLGADDYVTKPYDAEDLKDRIKVCLLRHRKPSPERPTP